MYKKDLNTMSGMWAVWDYDAYKAIDDYDKWEPVFCEDQDIEAEIRKRTFVPVNIGEDGSCSFTIRIDEELDEREKQYICVQSEPYLFRCAGKLVVSGIEQIGKNPHANQFISIDMPAGNYTVQVYLLSWDEEPGAYLSDGEVSPDALSDFVVQIRSNADMNCSYRERINTFSEDDDR